MIGSFPIDRDSMESTVEQAVANRRGKEQLGVDHTWYITFLFPSLISLKVSDKFVDLWRGMAGV